MIHSTKNSESVAGGVPEPVLLSHHDVGPRRVQL